MTRFAIAGLAVAGLLAAPSATAQTVYAIGVAQAGSLLYAGGVGVAKVMTEKLGLNARVQPFAGSSTYAPMIGRNELELGLINVDDAVTAYRGVENFDGKPQPDLRILCVLFPLPFGALVPADSPIKSMRELKGVRMPGQYAAMSTARKLQDTILASVGLSSADMQQLPVANLFQGVDALAQGRVDAAAIGPGTQQVQLAHTALSARGGIRYLQLDDSPQALERMRKLMAMRTGIMQPARHLPGIVEPTRIMFYSMFLMSNAKLADETAYKLVKALNENKPMLAEAHPVLRSFDPGRMSERSETPFHDGAIRYYREIGQWPPKD